MSIIDELRDILGPAHVLTGDDCAGYASDWTGRYHGEPLAVLRPGTTAEVSAVMKLASRTGTPVVPVAGNTGLMGGAIAPGRLLLSVERLSRIREVRADARLAVVEAGVILSHIHDAAEAEGLVFPLTFGARGSARIGGALSTNAGGSNVLRYGNTRQLCLGLEVVLPSGEVLDMMGELLKDNSGYDLRDLFVGAEGTLGIITAAVLRLSPKPRAYATAMVALPDLNQALGLLNALQEATGGAVEAFEYMPGHYIDAHVDHIEGARPPFAERHEVNVMVEVGATAPRDADPLEDGSLPIVNYLEEVLAGMIEAGHVLDATVARSEAQRREIWKRREDAAELSMIHKPAILTDVALPLDKVAAFLERAEHELPQIDPQVGQFVVSHLG
ncbi:hypothetical protein LCGC14_2479590, partial [marine sediment metagenome]